MSHMSKSLLLRSSLVKHLMRAILAVAVAAAPVTKVSAQVGDPAAAGTDTWDGSTSASWATNTNWLDNTLPANDFDLSFGNPASGFISTTTNDLLTGVNSFTFINQGGYQVGGNALTIDNGLANNINAVNTFNIPLTLTRAQTFSSIAVAGNEFIVGGTVNNGGFLLTVGGVGRTRLLGVVSGAGGLTKADGGELTLAAAHAYTGVTTINAGTLTLAASDRIADASAVSVAGGATLNLNNFGDTVANFSGAGVLDYGTVNNTLNAFVFGGDNADSTFSGTFLDVDDEDTLTKVGTGTWTYSGAGTAFIGTFGAGAGTTLLTGNLGTALGTAPAAQFGDVNVIAAANLIGTGSIGRDLTNGGTVSPGAAGVNSVGTLNIGQDFTQGGTGSLVMDVLADGTSDVLSLLNGAAVGGTATADGNLTLNADASQQATYLGRSFDIIQSESTTAGTAGAFASTTDNLSFLSPVVTFVQDASGTTDVHRVSFTFAQDLGTAVGATTPNQRAVAGAIQNLFTSGRASSDFVSVFNQFFVASPAEQQNFLTQLAGEIGTANMTAALRANSSFTSLALSQLQSSTFSAEGGDEDEEGEEVAAAPSMASFSMASAASGFGMPGFDSQVSGMPGGKDATVEDRDAVWVLGTGFWGDIDPTAINQGFEYDGSGFVLGYTFGDEDHDNWKWGLQGGFNESDIDTVGALDSSDVDSWNVGVHGAYFEDGDYVNVVGGYNKNEFDTTRFFNIGTVAATSRASFDGDEMFAYAEIGHVYDLEDDDEDVAQAIPGRKTPSSLMLGGMDAPHSKGAHKDHKRVEPAEEPVQAADPVEEEEEEVEQYGGEGWHAAPQLALQYRSYEQEAYTSTGAGALDQTIGAIDLDMFQTALGARFFHTSRTDEGGWIVPEVMLRWAHEFGDIDRTVRANFVGTTEVFAVNGIRPDRDALQLRAGVAAYTAKDWNFDVSYNGELSDNIENHAGVAKATWFFD